MLRRGPDPLELAGLLQRLERLHVTADASAAGWLPPARAAGELDAPPIADAPFVDPLVAEPVRPAAAKRVRPSRLAGLQARALDPGRRGVAVLAVVALCGAGGGAWYFLRAAPHAVSPATILGVVTAGLAPVSMGAAQLVARVAGIPCAWLVFVARTFARLPGAAIPWPSGTRGSLSLVAILGAGAVVVELWRSRRLRRWLGASVRLLTVAGVIAAGFAIDSRLSAHAWPPRDWVLAACDVGQGEAVVVRASADTAVLVDTGPAPPALDQCLTALGVRSLATIVLTGGSSSAVSGMPGALRERAVGGIDTGPELAADAEVRVRGWALASHIGVASAIPGVVHVVGNVRWRVVAELASARVVSIDVAGLSVLVAGDLNAADETELVAHGSALNADVLVVPHHGAAQDDAFLAAVHPRVAVVSVGRGNSQHDPSSSVLEALSTIAGRVSRTDQDGDIAISVSTCGMQIATWHGSR